MSAYDDDILECDACGDPEACGAHSWCYEHDSPLVADAAGSAPETPPLEASDKKPSDAPDGGTKP